MPDEITTAATLEEVLADHDWLTPRGYAWPCCTCGVEFPGGEDDAFAHVAAAVRSWLADRLADEGLREAVARRLRDETRIGPVGPNALDILTVGGTTSLTGTEADIAACAALAAVTAALGVGEGAA